VVICEPVSERPRGGRTAAAEAERRLQIVTAFDAYRRTLGSERQAVATVAQEFGVGISTIRDWRALVRGVERADWLAALTPARRGGGRRADIDEEAWQIYRSDWLRQAKPTHSSCYRRLSEWAAARGVALPHAKTFKRRIEREIPREVVIAMRGGNEALRRTLPAQARTVAGLEALSLVNIDGHRWDVFVEMPDGRVIRPVMVALQDVMSRKVLAWRIGETESAVLTRLAFADLFRDFGIPEAVLLDNGRAFASKWITGGAINRFRFKVRPDEPLGLLTQLGIRNHWATPYRGQSKPIERAFRDFCDAIARHPAFEGAWTGNKPEAKPENYASRAVPFEIFQRVVAAGIAEHNARPGRRTETAHGRSFDQVFAESYARAPIRQASPENLRRALLAAERVRADRQTGEIRFMGNRYWRAECSRLAGQLLTVRFDPDDLTRDLHVYDAAERYLFDVPIWEASGFLDAGAAKSRAKLEAEHRRTAKRLIELEELLSPAEVAARLPETAAPELPAPPRVVRPVRLVAAAAARAPETEIETESFVDRFAGAVSRLRLVEGE
jgi:putative transposase